MSKQSQRVAEPDKPRVLIRLAGDGSRWPPACFLIVAMRALHADPSEEVLILADTNGQRSATQLLQNRSSDLTTRVVVLPDVDQDSLLQQHLQNTSRIVWGDSSTSLPRQRRAFEHAWIWCPWHNETACPMLSRSAAEFEVQGRLRTAHNGEQRSLSSSALHDSRSCLRSIAVRSRWTRSQWIDLPRALSIEKRVADLDRGEWMLDDACVAYRPNLVPLKGSARRPATDRFAVLVQANSAARELLWPIPWHDIYAEYEPGYTRLDGPKNPGHILEAWTTPKWLNREPPLSADVCAWHNESAFITQLSMDNLYHALIHAVPTFELFSRLMRDQSRGHHKDRRRGLRILPHFMFYWPMASNQTEYVGWQIIARSLGVTDEEWPSVAQLAREHTATNACNCYRHVSGGHGMFMPPPFSSVAKSVTRVAAFRGAIAASLGHPASPERRILFQMRHSGSRQVVNEVQLQAAIAADPRLRQIVRFAAMEELPVMEQYRLIASAGGLVGVHGMGLAWTMLLPADARGTRSCLEILGMWPSFSRNDYYMLSKANGVYYMRMQQRTSPECICNGCNYRGCGNITANVTELSPVLQYMASRWDFPPLGGSQMPWEDRRPPPRRCHVIKGDQPKVRGLACDPYLWDGYDGPALGA